MSVILAKNWWSLVIRGLVAIALGVIAFAWHEITLTTLVLLFGAYAIIDGLIGIAGAVRAAEMHERWGILMLEGLLGVAVGVITYAWPDITTLAFVYLIAGWALATGAIEIAAAVRLRRYLANESLLALSGVATLILGILMVAAPLAGALAIAYWIGAYCFVFGALLVALGLRLRSWSRKVLVDASAF